MWSVSSWLFRWVLNRVAEDAEVDQRLREKLREIDDENLGWFSLDELSPRDRVIVKTWLAEQLVEDAVAELRPDLPERDGALRLLADLAGMAARLPR